MADDDNINITYIVATVPNYPSDHQIPSHKNKSVWILGIYGQELITAKGALGDIKLHQPNKGKSKVNISIFKIECFQRIKLEYLRPSFDQTRPVVSYLEFCIAQKRIVPKNIGDDIKVTQYQLWEVDLFVQYDNNKNINIISSTFTIKYLTKGANILR